MSYPNQNPTYNYTAPPPPGPTYGGPPQPGPYPAYEYNQPPPATTPYGGPPQAYGGPSAPPYKPTPTQPPYGGGGYGAPTFPAGTDPNLIACFQMADRDGSGFIDDKELQTTLSSYNQSFTIRTVHLLMYNFTNTNATKIGPREFTSVFYSLQNWRSIFERFDRDRSGKIDASELREALLSLGFSVSPGVLDLLISKFDKSGGMNKAIEYGNFIECCITVKGLTEKFKEKDTSYTGSASFTYEAFMLTVLPFLIA
ncbi:hypothetical protein LIER_01884 [Lithospermum erythrorhizon]|uniref:EF-hand domain-containing protein n=1 Tax=Lithospermum erythrorhizon TaxID=34254 RepID=A0AAV3NMH3_LITER